MLLYQHKGESLIDNDYGYSERRYSENFIENKDTEKVKPFVQLKRWNNSHIELHYKAFGLI